jgi:FkbM family methyltransferase
MLSDPNLPALRHVQTHLGAFLTFTDDLITRQLDEFGAHTRNELAMLLRQIDVGATVVDIGAHIGTFAVPIAKKIGSTGRLLAIEGDPTTFSLLTHNIGLNGLVQNVSCVNRVLGEGDSQQLARHNTPGNTGAGYYTAASVGMPSYDALRCLALSGFGHPDVIKIDVEGMECAILRSLLPMLQVDRPVLYLEVVEAQLARFGEGADSVDAILRPLGYKFYRNAGERNSSNDSFIPSPLESVRGGGVFFDLLALPYASSAGR